ncbi:transposable element Tcb1 transposase [Trichonephila clavipes]|nr:transposable element Tcb1 transposase [Trichonephila clavipes]
MQNSCFMLHHTGPAPGTMVWGDIGYLSHTHLVRIANLIAPQPARSPDLVPIENMWSMIVNQLTQITPPAATPDQLWQRMEAAWSAVSQETHPKFL